MILGLDFETTGLDTKTCEVTEVGAILWDEKTHRPVMMMNQLINGPKVPEEITALTGIQQTDLDTYGYSHNAVILELATLAKNADYIVAHNGTNFDKPIFERICEIRKPWIDTSVDIPYPEKISTRKLTHLAAEHGFLNPFAHRAVFDVLTMLTVLSKYDFEAIKAQAAIPCVTVWADVSYDDRELAKATGYRWLAERKRWIKTIKENQVEEEMTKQKFPVRRM